MDDWIGLDWNGMDPPWVRLLAPVLFSLPPRRLHSHIVFLLRVVIMEGFGTYAGSTLYWSCCALPILVLVLVLVLVQYWDMLAQPNVQFAAGWCPRGCDERRGG